MRVGQLVHEVSGADSGLGVNVELDFKQVLFKGADQTDDQLDDEVLVVLLQSVAGNEQCHIVVLSYERLTLMGFLRTNSSISARAATIPENLPTIILSISSLFFMVKLTLQELIEDSIKNRYFLFLAR